MERQQAKLELSSGATRSSEAFNEMLAGERKIISEDLENIEQRPKIKMPPSILGLVGSVLCSFPLVSATTPEDSMFWHIPMQFYWTNCLFKLMDALEAANGKRVSRIPIVLISLASFVFLPVFNEHIHDIR